MKDAIDIAWWVGFREGVSICMLAIIFALIAWRALRANA